MKNLHQLCAAVVLTLAFALYAYADDGHASCPAVTAPAPQNTIAGDMGCPTLTEIAEGLIQTVLSLS
jgi:hypothetical protein